METVFERNPKEDCVHDLPAACLRDIVGTVSFFCATGQAPTRTDVWRSLYAPSRNWSLQEVLTGLDALIERGVLVQKNGRVSAPWEQKLFEKMHDGYRDAQDKFCQVRRLSYWVACIPGVRALAVCNTLAFEATAPEGDSDLFVIARKGTLWFVRLFCVLPLLILRMRPGQRNTHTVDFTFFLSDAALDLSAVKRGEEDPYLAYWTRALVPLLDDGVLESFYEHNTWAAGLLPNTKRRQLAWYRAPNPRVVRALSVWRSAVSLALRATGLARLLEYLAHFVSVRRLPEAITSAANQNTSVVISEQMLKFHTTDRRQEITRTKQHITQKLLDRIDL